MEIKLLAGNVNREGELTNRVSSAGEVMRVRALSKIAASRCLS